MTKIIFLLIKDGINILISNLALNLSIFSKVRKIILEAIYFRFFFPFLVVKHPS